MTVTNNGPSTARGVTLVDTLPDDLTGVNAQGCTIAGTVATCDLGDLPPGAVVTLHVTGRVRGDVTDGTVLVDSATVSAAGDTVAGNNNATDQMIVVVPPPPPVTQPTQPTVQSTTGSSPSASGPSVVQGSGLPRTGIEVLSLVGIGVALILAGAALRRTTSKA